MTSLCVFSMYYQIDQINKWVSGVLKPNIRELYIYKENMEQLISNNVTVVYGCITDECL